MAPMLVQLVIFPSPEWIRKVPVLNVAALGFISVGVCDVK